MSVKPFHIYRSSAGSGKTRTLAKEYIKLALQSYPEYFRHILAVTFTNKATQEMKERILQYLNDFTREHQNDLSREIQSELHLTAAQLRDKSAGVQSAILHHYSQFAISTIDAFFQKVIRSFTREAGLLGNFRLEVENDLVLAEVVDQLMDELGNNQYLTDWVVRFSRDRLLEGENWNVVAALNGFAREIFNEEFQAIEDQLEQPHETSNPYQETYNKLYAERRTFEEFMKRRADEALKLLDDHGITADDFSYRDVGTAYRYFLDFSNGKYYDPSKARIQSSLVSANSWASKKSRRQKDLTALADSHLIPIMQEMVNYDTLNGKRYHSSVEVLKNFYAFGLITDITRKLKAYKQDNNLMLLSDAPKFLNGVINNSDTPFIYEKVGSFYRNYLIDEFQDTSGFQWKNFTPLLKDAIDQGQKSMLVGDVKQSIYRWRGGDQLLLQEKAGQAMGDQLTDIKNLNTNYRSAQRLVDFNNQFFHKAAQVVDKLTERNGATAAFGDVAQKSFKFPEQGYVKIEFVDRPEDGEEDWTSEVVNKLPVLLEDLQDKGVALRDIAILVRKNEEGQRIASELLRYKHDKAKPGYKYDVVSSESLRLDTATTVNLLLTALRFLHNPADAIVRGQLAYEVSSGKDLESIFLQSGSADLNKLLPEEFMQQASWLGKLSIFELTEELIRIFELGKDDRELTYLQAFQDAVLEFSALEKNDLPSFLEWWDNMKTKKSIQVAGYANAVSILTIHKAKGLQFKYVIVPFLSWKLNHEIPPLLWVRSDQPPFDTMGYLAVRYNNTLEKTFFSEDYANELVKAYIDNLNLLYVAFTRAEEGLFAFAATPRPNLEKPGNVGELTHYAIANDAELSKNFNDGYFEVGQLEKLAGQSKKQEYLPQSLNKYASYDWRKKLVIKREGSEFFLPETTATRTSINYGILLHRLLARVRHKADAEQALRELHVMNAITDQERELLEGRINSLLQHPVIGEWFAKDWEVLTEVPVLIPGGRESRIDRVMIGKKKTIIVDYKTGIKRNEDRRQIEGYAGLLSEMGYPNVEAWLLYLNGPEVVEVVSGSTLSLF